MIIKLINLNKIVEGFIDSIFFYFGDLRLIFSIFRMVDNYLDFIFMEINIFL